MIGKSPIQGQQNLFQPLLKEFIDMNHELVMLSEKINWQGLEEDFSSLYSNTGTPSKPIRLMCGLLILKQVYNLGDETLVNSLQGRKMRVSNLPSGTRYYFRVEVANRRNEKSGLSDIASMVAA